MMCMITLLLVIAWNRFKRYFESSSRLTV